MFQFHHKGTKITEQTEKKEDFNAKSAKRKKQDKQDHTGSPAAAKTSGHNKKIELKWFR